MTLQVVMLSAKSDSSLRATSVIKPGCTPQCQPTAPFRAGDPLAPARCRAASLPSRGVSATPKPPLASACWARTFVKLGVHERLHDEAPARRRAVKVDLVGLGSRRVTLALPVETYHPVDLLGAGDNVFMPTQLELVLRWSPTTFLMPLPD